GLTHGVFYAHFKSKELLVETALGESSAQLDETAAPLAEAEGPLAHPIDHDLSPRHRDNPGAGCPLPTLSAELGQRGTPSPTTDSIVRKRLAMIEAALEGEDAGERADQRSEQDEALSQRILEATRKKLLEQMER
ncbi:TetR/AcrR family transcriptional regulator, partial [Pseudomonas aeruginosa]